MAPPTLIDPVAKEYFDNLRKPMSREMRDAFLAQPHVAVMSVGREDRGPLSALIWYVYEPGGEVWFFTGKDSLKCRYLAPGVVVTLLMTTDFSSNVCVEGPVTSQREPTMEDALTLCHRYLGKEGGDDYARVLEPTLPYSVLLTVGPERWSSTGTSESAED